MADFQFYLNRQGIRGLQGVKGDQGDSPIITVQTETPNEYILKITNPDGTELISPNLRGNKININEGTYVRYNTETGELYTSSADGATGELAGVVRLATDADVTNMDEKAVVTPSQLADALSKYLVSPDGSVKIVQNAGSSLTELTAEKGLTELPIASANTLGAVKIGENLSITEDGVLSSTAGGDVSANGNNTFTGTNDFNGAVNLNGLTTAENLTVARNLTSSGEINAVSIKSTGIRSDDIKTTTNKKYLTEEDVDNQTIQIVNDKLHVNFDEINGEVSNVSSRVTTLEGQVGDISTTLNSNTTDIENLKETKNDNIFDIGKFTVVGNPTITDDGVASGFSSSNYLRLPYLFDAGNKDFELTFKVNKTSTGVGSIWSYRNVSSDYVLGLLLGNDNKIHWRIDYDSSTQTAIREIVSNTILQLNTYYYIKIGVKNKKGYIKLSTDGRNYILEKETTDEISSFKTYYDNRIGVNTGETIGEFFNGSIDISQFSITVDGKEVFSGLMESTKPIYDKITTLNTDVRDFELETSNNFSAVNSALNEKANLSDLSKCASLADFNRLSDTVTAVEADMLKKQNKLVQGDNITLTNNEDGTTTISASSTISPIIELVDGGNASGGVVRAQVAQVSTPLNNGAMPSTTVTVEDIV